MHFYAVWPVQLRHPANQGEQTTPGFFVSTGQTVTSKTEPQMQTTPTGTPPPTTSDNPEQGKSELKMKEQICPESSVV